MAVGSSCFGCRQVHLHCRYIQYAYIFRRCIGLNALIEANKSQAAFKAKVDPPTILTINVNGNYLLLSLSGPIQLAPNQNISDVRICGIVATTASVLIGVLTFNFIAMTLVPSTRALATRTLRLQAIALSFCSVWLLACLVPFTLFFATRRAEVRAFLGPLEIPQSLVHAMEAKSGSTSVYKELSYRSYSTIFLLRAHNDLDII